MGGTSCYGGKSSWCCLQPKKCRSQGCYCHRLFLHTPPVSPQTGGRDCDQNLVEANQGGRRSQREGEEITLHLRARWDHQSRPPPLALMQNIMISTARCSSGRNGPRWIPPYPPICTNIVQRKSKWSQLVPKLP